MSETPELFTCTLQVGWGDLDANGHMANTAYLDHCADTRMSFFASRGFSLSEFRRLKFGPVMRRDDIEYFREMHLLEKIRVTQALAGMSSDGARFRLRNEFYREDDKLAARITSDGGWLDLEARKLIVPPAGIVTSMTTLLRTEDFAELAPLKTL